MGHETTAFFSIQPIELFTILNYPPILAAMALGTCLVVDIRQCPPVVKEAILVSRLFRLAAPLISDRSHPSAQVT